MGFTAKLWKAVIVVFGCWCTLIAWIYKKTKRISHTKDLPDKCAGLWLSGRVTHISDGDGFKFFHCPLLMSTTFTSEDNKLYVRLAGIDAPEMGSSKMPEQPFAKESKKYLQGLIKDRKIKIKVVGKDQYNRVLAFAYVPGCFFDTNVNLEMVKEGLACVYDGRDAKYDKYEENLLSAEEEAKKRKKGMWKYKNPVTPMKHKRMHKHHEFIV